MKSKRSWLAVLGVAALAVPATALANHGHGKHGHANGHGKSHNVQYIFKGTYDGSGLVSVDHGNRHVRRADLVGTDVQFDLTTTRLEVADTNTDGVVNTDDVVANDHVIVHARLDRKDPGPQAFAARHLIDQTNPAEADSDSD